MRYLDARSGNGAVSTMMIAHLRIHFQIIAGLHNLCTPLRDTLSFPELDELLPNLDGYIKGTSTDAFETLHQLHGTLQTI